MPNYRKRTTLKNRCYSIICKFSINKIPAKPVAVELLYFEHFDPPRMDDLLTYGDDQRHLLSDNKYCIHQNQDKLRNASPDQLQCHDGRSCMWSQMQVQSDYEGDIRPS